MSDNPSILSLLPYQDAWLKDRARFKAGMLARQSGKTFVATLEIVDHIIKSASLGVRVDWVILSRGERQAQEALNEGVKKHVQAYNAVIKSNDFDWAGTESTHKALEVEFANGSKITALPAKPYTARGFSRNVLLDEFAFHHDSAKIWAAVFPVVTRGGKLLRVISTPNGKNNKFYDIMTGDNKQWSRHNVNIHQAIEQGLNINAKELRAALNDDEAWAREYELSWIDESGAWIPFDLISLAKHDDAGQPGKYNNGPVFIGNDIGRYHDLWVACAIEQVGDVYWLREMVTLKGASFAEQDHELDRLIRRYKTVKVCMDSTGLGMKPVEDAQHKYGSLVEGVNFTNANKHVMAVNGKQVFQNNKIRIPDDTLLHADLGKLRKSTTPTGAPKFDAEADSDGHADRTWALFLALYAANGGSCVIDYMATSGRISSEAFEPVGISSVGFGSVGGGYNTNGF